MNEQKQKFNHFFTLCDEYATARLSFTTAERAAESIREAVAERIKAEQAQTAGRMAELELMVQDGSRPASALRIWRQELDRLRGRTFSATPDEAAAFDTEMAAAQEAGEDMRRLQGKIREAISAVNGAITELRAQTLGDPVTGLWENRLDGVRKGFAPLCRGGERVNELQQHMRRFLESEIPAGERERINEEYKLDLEPGGSFLDALAAKAAQLAEGSERWAELAQQFEGIRGGGDG